MLNNFSQFIGQDLFKSRVSLSIEAAKLKNKALPHLLISGSSGIGKTTFAELVAKSIGGDYQILHGPNLQKPSDIIGVLTKLKLRSILFIDEIHAISKEVEETLYPVLSENKLNMVIGKEYNTKNIIIDLPSFTLIGATTLLYKLSTPLLNRFVSVFHFQDYEFKDMLKIIAQLFELKNIAIDNETLKYLVPYTRFNPRVANNLVVQLEDYCLVYNLKQLNLNSAQQILKFLNIFPDGLMVVEYQYLKYIFQNSKDYVLGLNTITNYLNEPVNNILEIIEPYLLRSNYLIKTSKGRKLTSKAIKLLKNPI
ncbi:Holliday junction branch migration DNA helicase RuvB [Spiroplasma endosymbiont of Amphibalanus improvisus]|uniref:Holliday junction branch migration DNA helicase RuvB n=1 Tax=Spiroplasma endosymbiont of Amphibalanus improvisus TaxID=3066327 RepID=UPI00313D81AB